MICYLALDFLDKVCHEVHFDVALDRVEEVARISQLAEDHWNHV